MLQVEMCSFHRLRNKSSENSRLCRKEEYDFVSGTAHISRIGGQWKALVLPPLAVYSGNLRISNPAFLNGTAAVMRSWINWRPSRFLRDV